MHGMAFPLGYRTTLDAAPALPVASFTPTLFAFADDFSAAGTFVGRPGWRWWSNDVRQSNQFKVAGGAVSDNPYGTNGSFATVDSGRTDTQFAQAAAPASGAFQLMVRVSDERDCIYLIGSVGSGYCALKKVALGVTSTIAQVYPQAVAAGDVWRIEIAGDALTVTLNGARWPAAGASYDVSAVPRSGKAGGTANLNYDAAGGFDDFATGYLGGAALVRLTLDPIARVVQRGKGATTKALAIGGQCSGVNAAPQMRLLVAATGAVVSGWDWGAKPLSGFTTDGTTWSATTAAIPQGDGYRIEVRDATDHDAGSRSNVFGVGIVIAIYGQSNAIGLSGGGYGYFTPATPVSQAVTPAGIGAGQPQLAQLTFDASDWPKGGAGRAGDIVSTASGGLPVAFVPGGYGGQPIAVLVPGSATILGGYTTNLWTALEQSIAAAGGDVEGMVYVQGESDAGSGGGPSYTPAATYKAGLDAMFARLKAITGRDATQLHFVIHGLGRVANAPNGYDDSGAWAAIRKAQYEWCRDTAGALLGSTAIDEAMDLSPVWPTPAWHRAQDDTGYGEDGKRVGAALAKLFGYAATDRRGPLPTGMTRSGSTLVIAFDPNGTTAMTCAAPIATNFAFATDASFATPLTPTAMAIDNAAHTVTFTFASAPPAGAAVRGPTGINPDVANALKGTQGDGASVMSWPIFDKLVAG